MHDKYVRFIQPQLFDDLDDDLDDESKMMRV